MADRYEFWETLDELGEEQVRKNLGASIWNQGRQISAREWLAFQDAKRAASAQDSAERANVWARRSGIAAILSVVVAAVGILLTVALG